MPLKGRLADLPGAVADDAVEQHAAVVQAFVSLFVRELEKLSRQPQGFGHVVMTCHGKSPMPSISERVKSGS